MSVLLCLSSLFLFTFLFSWVQENTRNDQFVKTEALFQYLTQLILFIINISKSTHNSPFFAGFQTGKKDRLSLNLLIIIQLNSL